MRGSVIVFYRARWPTYDTFQSRQTLARETRAARQPLDRNSSKSVRALRPTPLEACNVQQHHVACDVRDTRCCARMTCAPPQVRFGACLAILRTRIPRAHLKDQEGVSALATTFSSTAVRTAESCLFGCPRRPFFSTLPMPAPLERSIRLPAPLAARGTICSSTRARASRPTTCSRHRHARMFLPLDTTPMRIQARLAPPAACDAGLAAAFPHTMVQQHTAVLPCAAFTASCVRSARDSRSHGLRRFHSLLARHVHLQQVSLCPTMGAPRASITRHARPPAGAAAAPHRPCRGYHLPARCHCVPASLSSTRNQPLSGTGSTIRSTTEVRTERPSSAPTPATARNLDLQPTASTILRSSVRSTRCSCPPISHSLSAPHVHPQRHCAPLNSAAHFALPAPAAFAAMTRLRANSGPTTRRQCAPRAPTLTRLSLFASARRRTCAGRQRKRSRSIRCPRGFWIARQAMRLERARHLPPFSGPSTHSEHRGTQGIA